MTNTADAPQSPIPKRGYDIAIGIVAVAIVVAAGWPYMRGPREQRPQVEQATAAAVEPSSVPSRAAAPEQNGTAAAKDTTTGDVQPQPQSISVAIPIAEPAPSDCQPPAERVKAEALRLRPLYQDANSFIIALDTAVGVDTPTLNATFLDHVSVFHSKELSILLEMPYRSYRTELIEADRKREPLEAIPVPRAVVVLVSPSQIDSPDIVKVIVDRDGQVVSPIASTLAMKSFQTRMGATKMIHAGVVTYQCSAFAAGADVTITAIPEIGSNIIKKYPSAVLAGMR